LVLRAAAPGYPTPFETTRRANVSQAFGPQRSDQAGRTRSWNGLVGASNFELHA
jgi:hypothetical protein